MKKVVSILIIAAVAAFFMTGVSVAKDCADGKAMLDKAFVNAPDEMTKQYIDMAIQQCPDNVDIFKQIAQYYEHWYKTEMNADKQAEYKKLAEEYYQKAVASAGGKESRKLKTRLTSLQGSNEFNEVAFRALRPTKQGKPGSGLRLDVHFDRNSYNLSKTAQEHLDILGRILAEQKSVTICLEGHTDMTGTADYNKLLSIKRARSARDYIVNKYHVDKDRIQVAGYGFERLADREHPYSAVNRRVEVIKLSE